ncbi:hypothetical protein DVS28_b0002 (plasmid) [Euzebya pacifica]|uniref:Uncharacterized protein n=1 Tax=Euzebya pacifica TaxID=1608957 RepID=A0A346Y5M5_9ACTN|nr:hypothetical protein [Euzebya pacifica]AXV09772.1 hypothetical protein DVS28_b0002 [Euzebya pacifica]
MTNPTISPLDRINAAMDDLIVALDQVCDAAGAGDHAAAVAIAAERAALHNLICAAAAHELDCDWAELDDPCTGSLHTEDPTTLIRLHGLLETSDGHPAAAQILRLAAHSLLEVLPHP